MHPFLNRLNRRPCRFATIVLTALMLVASTLGWTQTKSLPVDTPAKDLRESLAFIPVTVSDRYGRTETMQIPLAIYRPPGEAAKPLVVFNHGRRLAETRADQKRSRPEQFARYMAGKGFVVIAPTRVGYADTYGNYDPEYAGPCRDMRLDKMMEASTRQVLATVEYAKSLPFVDTSKWLVVGQSFGGITTNATISKRPAGLIGGINFAGGGGGKTVTAPRWSCDVQAQVQYYKSIGHPDNAPMLWLYWENDLYWGPENPLEWHKSWTSTGARAEFHLLPAKGSDGHFGLNIDMDTWLPLVDRFLDSLGFNQPAIVKRPPSTSYAAIADVAKAPISKASHETAYKAFLALPHPRAIAVHPSGMSGRATGDYAVGRAMGICQRYAGSGCKLYAVDDDVVWQEP